MSFLDVGNSIRADDYRLACIDVSRLGFLTPHDFPPIDHPIPQGIPLAAQPLQQVPLGQAIIGEGAASSSSLEEEIDRFQFEQETMAPKTDPSLRELMKNMNKAPSPKDKNKSKPPVNPVPPPLPQIPANLGLKPNLDLRKKRHAETAEEGEMGPSKGSKQPK